MKCPKCQTDISEDSRFCSKCGTPIHPSDKTFLSATRTILRAMDELAPGTELAGKYRIEKVAGRGGMGIVYKAEDLKLKRHVALKFLPSELTRHEEARERFVLEAQAAAALSHPHICTIHEINEEEGRSFIVMEYIEGQSLKAKMNKGTIGLDEALDTAIQVTEGLEEAHQKGITHRDIKSANIMVTEKGQAKIMDFGLAKVKGGTLLTRKGTTLGTVAYMSPEQARGEDVDLRTDIWSLGVVFYEMFGGRLPFLGNQEASILYSVVHEDAKPLKVIKPDIPQELQRIVDRAMKKNPGSRYQSAAEVLKDLREYRTSLKAVQAGAFNMKSFLRLLRRPAVAIPAIVLTAAIVFVSVWFFNRQAKIRWVRQEAIPQIMQLVDEDKFSNAYRLALEAEKLIPGDPQLVSLWEKMTGQVTVETTPDGAAIYIKDHTASDEEWEFLGLAPFVSKRTSQGPKCLKIEKAGYETVQALTFIYPHFVREIRFNLDEDGSLPPGMIRVPGGKISCSVPSLDHLPPIDSEDYFMDEFEVTNKQFKEFVDGGGYKNPEYWEHRFVKEGQEVSWESAVAEFVDTTGRPGPAAWEMGRYPESQENYPVTGVSWYEAAAYAKFSGKTLPTIYHWSQAAGLNLSAYIVPFSNFDGKGPAPAGQFIRAMGPFGSYDMAGNVKEWCWNETQTRRYILGGSWEEPTYMFNDPDAQSPFSRLPTYGFRCMKYDSSESLPQEATAPIVVLKRDFRKEKPVSDDIFSAYKQLYSYDKTELNPKIEAVDEDNKDWKRERISLDAAYGGERLILYLYLPRNIDPPFQSVIYFPGSNAIYLKAIDVLNMRYFDFIIKGGRAVLFPVYKGTYERGDELSSDYPDKTSFYRDHLIMWSKDMRRALDYVETRQDIDTNKIAYCGFSWGAALGTIIPVLDSRLKVAVLNVGGFYLQEALPEVDQINFVTRVKIPTLMLNGQYDHFYPIDTSQEPMFDLLGTPAEHKNWIVYDSGHLIPRHEMIKETLNWLDRYLGPVKKM
jgi:formylglycine-generating enzyme required for sulfatase activity/tRNA A-37 threonylcarbamoyl transferase component Bud32/predicted esterase